MGFGIGIGIGWPNTSASAGPAPTERYSITSCTEISGACVTPDFPIGTYVVNDRLRYEYQGYAQFGLVDSITTAPEDNVIDIYPTGVNTAQCIDNNIEFISYNQPSEHYVEFLIDIKPLNANFISVAGEYEVFFNYYTEGYAIIDIGDGETDELPFYITGNGSWSNYNYSQGVQDSIFGASQNMDYPVLSVYTEYLAQSFYFANTYSFTGNDCDNHYFLRYGTTQNGSTFYASFINNDC